MLSLMIFMACFFVGIVATLFFLAHRIESCFHSLSEEHAQLRVLVRTLESRLDGLETSGDKLSEGSETTLPDPQDSVPGGYDSLLHLSFEKNDATPPASSELSLDLPPVNGTQ